MNEKVAELDYNSIKIGDKAEFFRTITQDDVSKFAELSGDFNPLHMDEDYASKTQFKGRIIHGMLAVSLFSKLVGMHLPGKKCLYLSQNVLFRLPIRPGERIKVQGEVSGKIDSIKMLLIKTRILGVNNELRIDGEAQVKVLD